MDIVPPRPRSSVDMTDRIRSGFTDLCVLLEGQHDFGSAVPPRGNVFRHEARFRAGWFGSLDGSGKAKVADFEVAIGIEEEIRGFEITVDDISGMECLESSEGLIDKVLGMIVRKILRPNNAVHVSLHELLDHWTSGCVRCVA